MKVKSHRQNGYETLLKKDWKQLDNFNQEEIAAVEEIIVDDAPKPQFEPVMESGGLNEALLALARAQQAMNQSFTMETDGGKTDLSNDIMDVDHNDYPEPMEGVEISPTYKMPLPNFTHSSPFAAKSITKFINAPISPIPAHRSPLKFNFQKHIAQKGLCKFLY